MRKLEGLEALGWDETFAGAFAEHAAAGLVAARVSAEHRARLVIAHAAGERDAVLGGLLRRAERHEERPAVGDWVAVELPADGPALVRAVLPRRSAFLRKAAGERTDVQVVAANVDIALVTTALPADVNLRRIERYLTLAWESGTMPFVVLTKSDLVDDAAPAIAEVRAAAPGVDVLAVSSLSGAGIDALIERLPAGRTAVLLGSSGVGKSTLINRLLGSELLRTGAVREDGRGRHTTTHRELVRLPDGALIIDTPGMRELQLWTADVGLEAAFADVEALAAGCRFADCAHETEPDCAVLGAVADGSLDPARLESWSALRRELDWLERRRDELASAQERAHAKSMQRLLRSHMKRKYER